MSRIDVEAIDQCFRLGIGVGIELHARRAIAREKALEPQHVGIFGAADDHRSADAGLEHLRAAQDQRAHQPFAKLGFGDQQSPHPVGRKDQRLDRLGNYAVAERRPAGELRQFANERARAECVKVLALAVGVVAVNVNLAAENDGEAEADFADRRQRLAGREAAYFAEAPGALDIRRIEMREDLVASRLDDRRAWNYSSRHFSNGGGLANLPPFGAARLPANIDRRR